MVEAVLLRDLAVVMAVAAVTTILSHRLRQPVVLGYLVAGVIIGPYTLPFSLVTNIQNINTLAELGVIFLVFSLGLEFSLRRLRRVGAVALVAGALEILIMLWIGFTIGRGLGWSSIDSIFLGAILSISSTMIITKVLRDLGKVKEDFAEVVFGILVVEDLAAIVIIALLSGIAMTGTFSPWEVGATIARVGLFLATVLVAGILVVPRLINYVSRFRKEEALMVTVLGLCFSMALVALYLGFSVVLGAFVMGAIISESWASPMVVRQIAPLRDMFAAVFFVATGMLIKPALVSQYALPIVLIAAAAVLGNIVSCSLATFLLGYPPRFAMKVGISLATIGEFSFIIASLGLTLGVTSAFLYPIAVSVSSITAFLGPLMIRNSDRLTGSLARMVPRPLTTYLSLYGRLVAELKTHGKKAFMNEETEPLLAKLATNLLVVMAVLVTGRAGVEFAEREEALAGLVNAIWVLVGLLLLPFLYTSLRLWDAFLGALIGQAVARHHGHQAERVGTVLKNSLRLLTALLLGSLVLAVGSPFLPPLSVASIVFASVGMAALLLWESIQEAHRGVEGTVLRIFEKELPEERIVRAAMADAIRREYPWGVDFEAMPIREASPAAGKSLKDLDVRGKTGAMVVYLRRSGEHLVNPPPSTVLHPGDVAILIGDEEQLNRAKRLLLIP